MTRVDDRWQSLLNFVDFSNWERWLAVPEVAYDIPGLGRDSRGRYVDPLGADHDPLGVWRYEKILGVPVLRVSGEVLGALTTKQVWSNYRLRLVYRWGRGRWQDPGYPHNSGILYHAFGEQGGFGATPDAVRPDGPFMTSVEFQLQRGGAGDLIALGPINAQVRSRPVPNENWSPRNSWRHAYDPAGPGCEFGGLSDSALGRRVHFAQDAELPVGEWNTAELCCYEDRAAHLLNGKTVLVATDLRHQPTPDGPIRPLVGGRIQIQSEGCEFFVRALDIRPVGSCPPELLLQRESDAHR